MKSFVVTASLCVALSFAVMPQKLKYSPSPWQIGLRFSPEFSYRILPGDMPNDPYTGNSFSKENRNKNENGQLGYSTGIFVSKDLNDNLSVEGGVQVIKRGFYADHVPYEDIQNKYKYVSYNRDYYSFSIPLKINYVTGGEHLKLLVSGGLNVAVLTARNESIYAESDTGMRGEIDGNYLGGHTREQPPANLYLNIGVGILYHINERFSARAEAVYRPSITRYVKSYYGPGLLWNAGIDCGIYMRL